MEVMPTPVSVRSERLGVVGVDDLPAERLFKVPGEGLLDQAVFAVDVSEGHSGSHIDQFGSG